MKIKKIFTPFVLLFLFIFTASIMAGEAGPGVDFLVDNTVDAIDANPGDGLCSDGNGECTLRAAIMESNALEGSQSVYVLAGTYLLTLEGADEDGSVRGDLDILDDLDIEGELAWNGQPAAIIQGDNADRVVHIFPNVIADMEGLTITGGNLDNPTGGAGIYNQGDLHLYGSHVVGNVTTGTGGGIRNEGTLFFDASYLLNNIALEGGAIYNLSELDFYSANIYDNTSSGSGGGIFNASEGSISIKWAGIGSNTASGEGSGGGIYNLGFISINDLVEVNNNKAGGTGGGIFNQGKLEVYYLDFVRNESEHSGGGLMNRGQAVIDTATFVENSATFGGGIAVFDGILELKYGHFERNTAYQGGAIGNLSVAFLDEVIIQANNANDGGAIFNKTFENQPEASLTIQNTTIVSNTATSMGGGVANYDGILEILDSTLAYNFAENGGGIFNELGSVSLQSTVVSNCSATSHGGGIYNDGNLDIHSSDVSENDAVLGGGIFNLKSTILNVNSSLMEENTAESGGAVYNSGVMNLVNNQILNNKALFNGGGLVNENGQARLEKSLLYGNIADNGGGIYNAPTAPPEPTTDPSNPREVSARNFDIESSTISNNSASSYGGAIFNDATMRITNSTISGNGESSIHAISAYGLIEFGNSIVSGSISGSNCSGGGHFASLDYNLEAGNSCGFSEAHDLVDTDPMLMISEDKPVLELHPSSPAIDSGDNEQCAETDQIGNPRPTDGDGDGDAVCDIGAFEAPAYGLAFADVPLTHWAYHYIVAVHDAGYVAGCASEPQALFCPENIMNRAESAVFVVRGIHPNEPGYIPQLPTTQYFNDVPIGAQAEWFSKWVTELYEQGFTSGCSENPPLYCPTETHNRAEATVFYLRMLKGPDFTPEEPSTQSFHDVFLDEWYAKWVDAAYHEALIQPCQTDMRNMLFRPEEDLTRAEAACMMYQAINRQVTGSVLLEDGRCCAGGPAGESIEVAAAFQATSALGMLTDMRILSGTREFTDLEMEEADWEPFVDQKSFSVEVPLNWSTFYVYVQYRDDKGDISLIYSDSVGIEGEVSTPTPTPLPPTATPTPVVSSTPATPGYD